MKRVLKFRVWNEKTNSWVHGPGQECNLLGEMVLLGGFMKETSLEDLNNCVVCQFTGMKDSNGKEIYENDILQCEYKGWLDTITGQKVNQTLISDVHWDEFGWNLDEVWTGIRFYEDKWEVVGNVFENKELLNPKGGIAVA